MKFGQNPEIWLKSWYLVKILKFGWNPEVWLKSWNLATRRSHFYRLQNVASRWRHLHQIQIGSWDCLLVSSASIELVSSSTRHTSVKSTNMTQLETLWPIDRTPGIPGSDKNATCCFFLALCYMLYLCTTASRITQKICPWASPKFWRIAGSIK